MDKFLMGSAIVLLVFGILLLLKPDVVKRFSDFLNKSILPVEDKMRTAHVVSGVMLLILSAVVFYLSAKK